MRKKTSRSTDHHLYDRWAKMRSRARAEVPEVTVHPGWEDFSVWLQDAGEPPDSSYIFGRLDLTKGFTPDNTKWMSPRECAQVRGPVHIVEGKPLWWWSEKTGKSTSALRYRLSRGIPFDK